MIFIGTAIPVYKLLLDILVFISFLNFDFLGLFND